MGDKRELSMMGIAGLVVVADDSGRGSDKARATLTLRLKSSRLQRRINQSLIVFPHVHRKLVAVIQAWPGEP